MNSPLHNINIERSILSTIMFNSVFYAEVSETLNAEDFYYPAHRNIFIAMAECDKQDLPLDEEFIKKSLLRSNAFDEDAMLEVLATNPLPSVGAYLGEIKEKAQFRNLHVLANNLGVQVQNHSEPIEEIINSAERVLFDIASGSDKRDFSLPETTRIDTLKHIKEMANKARNGVVGVTTGFQELNKKTTGFNNGDLIILAARPSMGKTGLVLNMIDSALKDGKGVAMFSLEMPKEQIMLRLYSSRTSIPLARLKIGDLKEEEWGRIELAAKEIEHSSFFINDEGNITMPTLRGKLRKLKAKHPDIKLCVVDYLQLMSSQKSEDRHLQISEISRGLKLLARELNMPIIALSQLNRSLESRSDKRPMLSDLRESGSIEQDADIVMFVYRDDVYKMQEAKQKAEKAKLENLQYTMPEAKPIEDAEIIIAKNRNGPLGVAYVSFHKEIVHFKEKAVGEAPVTIVYDDDDNYQPISMAKI
jgi:replicative DNA helicase